MPSVSKSQQRLMGMALAYKKGELENASDAVKKLADSMTLKELEDFAKTKHGNLPEKVKSESFKDFIKESPDGLFMPHLKPIPFIIFKDSKQLINQISNDPKLRLQPGLGSPEEREAKLKEWLRLYKIPMNKPIVLYQKEYGGKGELLVNNINTKLPDTSQMPHVHYSLIYILINDAFELNDRMSVWPDGRMMGVTSGRVTFEKGKNTEIPDVKGNLIDFKWDNESYKKSPIVSFWTDDGNKYMSDLVKNTKKFWKWPAEIEVETAEVGNKSRSYGVGNFSSFTKQGKPKKVSKGKTQIEKPRPPLKKMGMSTAVRQRKWPGLTFEGFCKETITEGIGPFKKVVALKEIGRGDLENRFSGWYLPKENTLIYMHFGGHNNFMANAWPVWTSDDPKVSVKHPEFQKIYKKYIKEHNSQLKKGKSGYDLFYNMGWVRLNLGYNFGEITYGKKADNKDDIDKLLLFFKNNTSANKIEVEGYDSGYYKEFSSDEIKPPVKIKKPKKKPQTKSNSTMSGGDVITGVRQRKYPGFKFESEITEGIGPFKKVIYVKDVDGWAKYNPKKIFSAWYIPKDNTLITFDYAGHTDFMQEYWPYIEADELHEPNKSDSKLNPIVKKYSKDVINWLSRADVDWATYQTFYDLGWMKINLESRDSYINYGKKGNKEDEIQKLKLFLKYTTDVVNITTENADTNVYQDFKAKDIGMEPSKEKPVDVVRKRTWPGFKFEQFVSEGIGPFKKYIHAKKVDSFDKYNPKSEFSAWYIPKDNTFITFKFAGHNSFMGAFWPDMDVNGNIHGPEGEDPALNPIVKKYSKDVLKWLKKNKRYVYYDTFYDLGWIRVNLAYNDAYITFNNKGDNKDDIQKLKLYLKYNTNAKMVTVENEDKDSYTQKTADVGVEPSDESPLDAVRGRRWPGAKFESEITEGVGPFKKFIVSKKVESWDPYKEGKDFSGWYIPKDNTFIAFAYAGHYDFMQGFFPNLEYDPPKPPRKDSKLNPIVKKYSKDVINWLSSHNDDWPDYQTFYDMGWIRVNLTDKEAYITYGRKGDKEDEIQKLKLYVKYHTNAKSVATENKDTKDYQSFDVKDIEAEVSDESPLDAVRRRKWPGFKFEQHIKEAKDFKKIISLKGGIWDDAPRDQLFSAWYLPKEDILIQFEYAGHYIFMNYYWPKYDWVDEGKYELQPPKNNNVQLDKIIKKYKNKIIKWQEKNGKGDPISHDAFLQLGWMKINNSNSMASLDYNKKFMKDEKALHKVKLFIKNNTTAKTIGVDEASSKKFIEIDVADIPDVLPQKVSKVSGDVIDKARAQIFGPKLYEGIGPFKKTIPLSLIQHIGETVNIKSRFSGWYLPKENILVYFPFGGHIAFMSEYFPARHWKTGEISKPEMSNKQFDSVVKKHSKYVIKQLKKVNYNYVTYEDLYDLGWVRINHINKSSALSYGKKVKASDINKMRLFIKHHTNATKVHDENVDTNRVTMIDTKDISPETGGDPISSVRARMFGPQIYEGVGPFKKTISIKSPRDGRIGFLNKSFSAWYLPKENTLVYFNYAGHQMFMSQFWPYTLWDDEVYPPRHEDAKLNPIVKKYAKSVTKWIKKYGGSVEYSTLYDMGWIRVNLNKNNKIATITHTEVSDKDLDKLKFFIKYNTNAEVVQIENNDTYKMDRIKVDDIVPGATKGKPVDVVRDRMFGAKVYEADKPTVSFDFDLTLRGVYDDPITPMIKTLKQEAKNNNIVILTTSRTWRKPEIWEFVKRNKLPVTQVICTNGRNKWKFIKPFGISKHYDDDEEEIQMINKRTKAEGIHRDPPRKWLDEFWKLHDKTT